MGIPLQKKSKQAQERSAQKRTDFRQQISAIAPERLVFLDECGFSLNLCRPYGWALSEERCLACVPFQRGVNPSENSFSLRSVLGAFGLSGMCALSQKLGSFKRVDFEEFLRERLLPCLKAGSVLVLDNARIHHGGAIAALVAGAGCSLLYLPAYSPDFSPIELAWGWIKGRVRREEPRDDEQRRCAIEAANQALPGEFALSWFRKCGYHQY